MDFWDSGPGARTEDGAGSVASLKGALGLSGSFLHSAHMECQLYARLWMMG